MIVTGRLEQRSWETQDGDKRSKVEVVADEIGPSCGGRRPRSPRTSAAAPVRAAPAAVRGGLQHRRAANQGAGRRWIRLRRGAVLSDGTVLRSRAYRDVPSPPAPPLRPTPMPSALCRDKVEWVDYKNVPLLRRT